MRVLVTGGAGLLGTRLAADAPAGVDLHRTRHRAPPPTAAAHAGPWHQVDLADRSATDALVAGLAPDLVVHTAYGATDGERDIVAATAHVAEAAAAVGAGLIHLSSDMVFDGEHAPYAEGDHPVPISRYGRQKAEAEAHVGSVCPQAAIVRTSLITWATPLDPRSAWVADSLRTGATITLFTDEVRCPVRLDDLSAQVWELAGLAPAERKGFWHLVGAEALSRHDLGVLIARHAGLDPTGITSARSHSQPHPRPRDLRLTSERADAALATSARSVRTLFASTPSPSLS